MKVPARLGLLVGAAAALLFCIQGAVAGGQQQQIVHRPVVNTTDGRIRGLYLKGRNNGADFYAFRGIPYAAPPVGENRFKPPQPVVPWDDIRNATKDGHMCPHFKIAGMVGAEDCLFLNVYTPKLECPAESDKLAVVVYVHGGGFLTGGVFFPEQGPDFLLKHDVVLVALNYRLGVLGFLNLNTPGVPGNAGLKDMLAALRWVQANIATFCGDPQKVTFMGWSAGAKALGYLGLTKESEGLFRAGIALSGTALDNWGYTEDNVARGKALAAKLSNGDNDIKTVERILRDASVKDLVAISTNLFRKGRPWGLTYNFFNPSRELRPDDDESKLLPKDPDFLIRHTSTPRVPILIGVQRREGRRFINSLTSKQMNSFRTNFSAYLREDILRLGSDTAKELGVSVYPDEEMLQNITRLVNQEYFHGSEISFDSATEAANIIGDLRYVIPLYKTLLWDRRESPMYVYEFNVEDSYNPRDSKEQARNVSGSTHGDELNYFFRVARKHQDFDGEGHASQTLRFFTKLIADFAKNLSSPELPPDATKNREQPPYLYIGERTEVRKENFVDAGQRLAFWRRILEALRTPGSSLSTETINE